MGAPSDPRHQAATLLFEERRRYPRAPMDRPVKLLCQDKSIHIARLCELSLDGLSLLADRSVKDNRFAIYLRLPQLDETANKEIVLGCRLVHRSPMLLSGPCKLGIHIDEIPQALRR